MPPVAMEPPVTTFSAVREALEAVFGADVATKAVCEARVRLGGVTARAKVPGLVSDEQIMALADRTEGVFRLCNCVLRAVDDDRAALEFEATFFPCNAELQRRTIVRGLRTGARRETPDQLKARRVRATERVRQAFEGRGAVSGLDIKLIARFLCHAERYRGGMTPLGVRSGVAPTSKHGAHCLVTAQGARCVTLRDLAGFYALARYHVARIELSASGTLGVYLRSYEQGLEQGDDQDTVMELADPAVVRA